MTMFTEIYDSIGPTGRYVEALVVAVCDYGDNELGRATTQLGLARVMKRWQHTPTLIHIVKTGAPVVIEDMDPDDIV
jgi:hypothetical protein